MKELVENTQGFFRMAAYLIGVHRETAAKMPLQT